MDCIILVNVQSHLQAIFTASAVGPQSTAAFSAVECEAVSVQGMMHQAKVP